MRQYSLFDKLLIGFDKTLNVALDKDKATFRENPAKEISETSLSGEQIRHVAGLMRVNHAGEICAQALYEGQATTAKEIHTREKMEQAAREEMDHLSWCSERLTELNSHTSYLNPIWYLGSFTIGAVAGWIGDRWSLGFVAETEHQVTEHLNKHLTQIPKEDHKTRAILTQMRDDEKNHAIMAINEGAAQLPYPIKLTMQLTSKIMTWTSFWV